ncbi:heterokaryon incompatibility protein-domain-containing protein [Halenospora varia]|nr:heterokaryon incompatibility protein-domain-containing protein [Halenospora varia]
MEAVITLLNLDTSGKIQKALKELDRKVISISSVVNDTKQLIGNGINEKDYKKIMDWLSPINQAEIHAAALRKHEEGTGEWFLEGSLFEEWRCNAATSLWLFGDVGCGKTVLFSAIVDRIRKQEQLEVIQGLSAYFYCLYSKGAQHNVSTVLQTFIAQLCPQNDLPSALQELYDKHNSKFPPGIPSHGELKNTLLAIIGQLGDFTTPQKRERRNVFLLIDALDELPSGASRDDIIGFLDEIASRRIPHLRILVTGRAESDIREKLSSWGHALEIDKSKVIEDMRLFVTHEIENDSKLSGKPVSIKNDIIHRLVNEGNGMFRWAALQMEQLRALPRLTPRKIQQILQSLPQDLDKSYEKILSKINPLNSHEALSALQWISQATRPLYIEELVEVCAINLDSEQTKFDAEERYYLNEILDLLRGLVTVNPPVKEAETPKYQTHVVSFAHFSVQEYLLGTGIKSSPARLYSLNVQDSNHFIAECCLAYLLCCNSLQLRKEDFPLRDYAWNHWAWHAVFEVGKSIQELSGDAEMLFTLISHQAQLLNDDKQKQLMGQFSRVAKCPPQSSSRCWKLKSSLSVPFFYSEFDDANWDDTSTDLRATARFDNTYEGLNTGKTPALLDYEYQPLKQTSRDVRLVELYPSSKKYAEIRCRIFHRDLDSSPDYDGVSYSWEGRKTARIRINGLLLEVPASLVADLKNLRTAVGGGHSEPQILFVDAICFDWAHPQKAEHWIRVDLMPIIFKQAQQVAIGLGDRDEEDASAIEFVHRVATMSASDVATLENQSNWSGKENDERWADRMGVSVLRLFQRHWWRRLWPVQELILPRKATLYYGEMAITFDTFQSFFEKADIIRTLIGDFQYSKLASEVAWVGATRISKIRTHFQAGNFPSLAELLWATQHHQSRDRSTKVYGLISLLCPDEQKSELLKREHSLTDEERFILVAIYILQKHRNLDILSYASCHHWENVQNGTALPSWVPNFSSERSGIEPLIRGVFGPSGVKDLYDAGGKEILLPLLPTLQIRVLKIQGYLVDYVRIVQDVFTGSESKGQLLELYASLEKTLPGIKCPQSQSVSEAFWRTLYLDQIDSNHLQKKHEAIVSLRLGESSMHDILLQKEAPLNLQHCKGRRILLSSQGYICLGPSGAEANDVISVLPGGKVPYLLRKSGDNFKFIGECYVHGIMDSEIIVGRQKGKNELEWFSIL